MVSTSVLVTRKVLSNGLTAALISFGDFEGMTLPEITRVFGIPRMTITDHMKAKGFDFCRNSVESRKYLIAERVIPITGRPPKLVSKEAIQSLVRFISTEETDATYAQLWDVVEAVQKGDIQTAQTLVGLTPAIAISHLKIALAGWEASELKVAAESNRADSETKLRVVADKRAYSSMGTSGAMAKRAYKAETTAVRVLALLDSALIGPDLISLLDTEITQAAQRLTADPKLFHSTSGVIKKSLKARYAGARSGSTYKEISLSDFTAAIDFIKALTPELVALARTFENSDSSLVSLKAVLVNLGF